MVLWKDGKITLAIANNYHDEQNKQNILKMRNVLTTLPPFCKQFFLGIEEYTSSRPVWLMLTISGFSLNSYMRLTAYATKWKLLNILYHYLTNLLVPI